MSCVHFTRLLDLAQLSTDNVNFCTWSRPYQRETSRPSGLGQVFFASHSSPEDCWVLRVRLLWFLTSVASTPGSSHPDQPSLDNSTSQPLSDATYPSTIEVLTSLRHALFIWQEKTEKRWYKGKMRQTMVDSWYGLDQVVPDGMSQTHSFLLSFFIFEDPT